MKKKMLFDSDVRKKLLEGAEIVYKAVGSSYSPKGRLSLIGRPFSFPLIHADGVNIAKEVGSEDFFLQQAILTIIEAAKEQNDSVGDGTTVVTILAYHLTKKGFEFIDEGVNPAVIRKQINLALPPLLDEIKKYAIPVKDSEAIKRVARISSSNDDIAEAVTEAVEKIGKDGQITVEKNELPAIEVAYNEGLRIEKGMTVPNFVTDINQMEAVVEDAAIVIVDKRLTTQLDILPLLEMVAVKNKNILLIGDIDGEALRVCIVNKMKRTINIVTVPLPASGDKRKELLEDIAIVTGSKIIKEEIGLPKDQFMAQFDSAWIGESKMVVSDQKSTLIVRKEEKDMENAEDKKRIKERNRLIEKRIDLIRTKRDEAKNIYDKEKYEERLAKLTTGVGVIRVGAKTEIDIKEKIERVKDAVSATKACRDGGIVPGGGVIFLQISKILANKKRNYGEDILYQALQEPIKKLLENAGESQESSEKIIQEIQNKGGNTGYNVESEKLEDLIKTGVIDPAKVISQALENSVSVAGKMILTGTMIVDVPEVDNTKIV